MSFGSATNYGVGSGSWGTFGAFSNYNASGQNFLLNRDLSPASNDNTPAGVEKVA